MNQTVQQLLDEYGRVYKKQPALIQQIGNQYVIPSGTLLNGLNFDVIKKQTKVRKLKSENINILPGFQSLFTRVEAAYKKNKLQIIQAELIKYDNKQTVAVIIKYFYYDEEIGVGGKIVNVRINGAVGCFVTSYDECIQYFKNKVQEEKVRMSTDSARDREYRDIIEKTSEDTQSYESYLISNEIRHTTRLTKQEKNDNKSFHEILALIDTYMGTFIYEVVISDCKTHNQKKSIGKLVRETQIKQGTLLQDGMSQEEVKEEIKEQEIKYAQVAKKITFMKVQDGTHKLYAGNKYTYNLISDKHKFLLPYKSEYICNNYIANACLYTIIIDTFKKSLAKTEHYPRMDLTYLNLYNFVHGTFESSTVGLSFASSLSDFLSFFKKYQISVYVYSMNLRLIHQIINETNDDHITHKLYFIMHNRHVYLMNSDMMRHGKQQIDEQGEEELDGKVSYKEWKFSKDDETVEQYEYHNASSLLEHISKTESQTTIFYHGGDMTDVFFELYNETFSFAPLFNNGFFRSLHFCYGKGQRCSILPYQDSNNQTHDFKPFEIMQVEKKYRNKLRNSIMNINYISYYTPQVRKWFYHFSVDIPICKVVQFDSHDNITEIDQFRCYTSCWYHLECLPIFSNFDRVVKYNGQPIEDYTCYLIKVLEVNHPIFNKLYSHIYGRNLKKLKIDHEIVEFCKPANIKKNKMPEVTTEIYNHPQIDNSAKKQILNITIGQLGTKHITKNVDGVYYEEFEDIDLVGKAGRSYPIINKEDKIMGYWFYATQLNELSNGFKPIHTLILDEARMRLYEQSLKLQEQGYEVVGYKTDALYYRTQKKYPNIEFKGGDHGFGGLKFKQIDEFDSIHNKKVVTQIRHVDYIDCTESEVTRNKFETPDEKNINYADIPNNVVVSAEYPGCGKSFLCKQIIKHHTKKTLICAPTSALVNYIQKELVEDLGSAYVDQWCTVKTTDSAFGLNQFGQPCERTYDLSSYEVVMFDELYLNGQFALIRLKQAMETYKNILFIGNGDPGQLENPDKEGWTVKYKNECINSLFPNYIHLQEIKRQSGDDVNIIKYIKQYIKEVKGTQSDADTIKYIIDKWFANQKIKEFLCGDIIGDGRYFFKGLCLTNELKDRLNNNINAYTCNYITETGKYYVGQNILSKDYISDKNEKEALRKGVVRKGDVCEITQIKGNKIQYKNLSNNEFVNSSIEVIDKKFTFPNVRTIYSQQGYTYKIPYLIYETDHHHTSVADFWVAITRTCDLKNVYIWAGEQQVVDGNILYKFV